jgi:hypothetical protein
MKKLIQWLKDLFAKDKDRPSLQVVESPLKFDSKKPLKLLRVPFAVHDKGGEMKTAGYYRKGYPEGAVVHFTAGRHGTGAISTARKNGYCYFLIDQDGTIYQNFDLNRWGSHAGQSKWPSLGESVSKYLVGIEITSGGKLKKQTDGQYKTWFDVTIPTEKVRCSDGKDNIEKGCYEKFTDKQEESLISLLSWLYKNNPDVFKLDLVLGHDSVCYPKGRKNDPGGSLSMTIPELQHLLKIKLK